MKIEQSEIPIKILFADDDVDDRLLFKNAIKGISISTELTTVNNGEELMNYLFKNYKNLPDILFLDLSMPRKTGFECLTEMNEDEQLKNISVVVFTTSFRRDGEFELNLANTLINMGAKNYIPKPSDFVKLKEVVHQELISVLQKPRTIKESKLHQTDPEQ